MSQNITIFWDAQDEANAGWAYRIAHGASGAIDGQAADAVDRILDGAEAKAGDHDALREAIEHTDGDLVRIIPEGGLGTVRLGELLDA